METLNTEAKVCPKCGKEYRGHPAISRTDGQTAICQLCGTREALENLGLAADEIEKIVAVIPNFEEK